MIHIENQSMCCGCNACAQICPKHCITMQPDAEGFLYPQVDESACIHCDLCEKACPILQSPQESKGKVPDAYSAINKNEEVRGQSSSGGVFSLLAEQTIQRGGVVFGAAMADDQHGVHHIVVETPEGLAALRGSKYLQSEVGNTYNEARQALQAGREVLFSGTPCQIEGLRTFLQQDYPNLLCVDVICHGVPSPLVWNTYLAQQEARAGAQARRTFFRYKKYGWKTYALLLEFSNNKVYECVLSRDAFMQAFLRNACLRPSCHSCRFKKLNRASDITLADYWGIQDQYPEMDDDKGTSLVLVHSEKGQRYLDALCTQLRIKDSPIEQALIGNPSMLHSAKAHRRRKQFFDNLGKMPFDALVAKYCKPERSLKNRLKSMLKKIGVEKIVWKLKRTKHMT